jgi:SAM-dependent methyltransferase
MLQATPFRCPGCQEALNVTDGQCANCGRLVGDPNEMLNLVRDQAKMDEASFYDAEYDDASAVAPSDAEALRQLWIGNPYAPYNEAIWRRMSDIEGKTVLVLGSGAAPRELSFITLAPHLLVISDLSQGALRALQRTYLPERPANVAFAAIDAEDLPFADGAVDVVYGYLFVHHLPHLDAFLAEVARVLRPSGRAVFLDSAYAPLWEGSKRSWLRGLMRQAHRVNPPSPEDMRFTMAGGFKPEDLDRRIRAIGGIPFFERSGSLHYLIVRASEILARKDQRLSLGTRRWVQSDGGPQYTLEWKHHRLLSGVHRLDVALADHVPLVARNRVRLIWGFEMPSGRPHPAAVDAEQTATPA